MPLKTGEIAPDFTLPVTPEGTITLSALRPAPVVLFFYPKDDTPGCTIEGRDFSALGPEFTKAGTRVIGLSRDDMNSHRAFCAKYDMAVALAADTSGAVSGAYKVLVPREGEPLPALERTTYLIDRSGKIAKVWVPTDVTGHAAEVLDAARALARTV